MILYFFMPSMISSENSLIAFLESNNENGMTGKIMENKKIIGTNLKFTKFEISTPNKRTWEPWGMPLMVK